MKVNLFFCWVLVDELFQGSLQKLFILLEKTGHKIFNKQVVDEEEIAKTLVFHDSPVFWVKFNFIKFFSQQEII